MSSLKPMIVYAAGYSGNPWKVIMVLEELGLLYEFEMIDFGDVKKEPYISVNPNGRVPAMIDPNKGITLWESGAIIDYLIDVYDTDAVLHYTSFPEKYTTRCWEHFQMSGQGPYFGQKAWFSKFHPEKLPSAIERYHNEVKRVIGVIDGHLEKQGTDYLVGNKMTYADVMFLPWFKLLDLVVAPDLDTAQWQKYNTWLDRMYARPGVARAVKAWDAEAAKAAVGKK